VKKFVMAVLLAAIDWGGSAQASAAVTFRLKGHGDATFNNNFVVTGCPINWFTAPTKRN
jgi:hypothetical protein